MASLENHTEDVVPCQVFEEALLEPLELVCSPFRDRQPNAQEERRKDRGLVRDAVEDGGVADQEEAAGLRSGATTRRMSPARMPL